MIAKNPYIANINAGYLFPEIARRRREYEAAHPDAHIISLGIGNTTEPLPLTIDAGLVGAAEALATEEGYTGYGDEQGETALREKIADVCYRGKVGADEIFISDGAKCDIGRLQLLFGKTPIAVQDPSYPVYVDGSVLVGAAGAWNGVGYDGITYLPCTAENGYFPDLGAIKKGSVVYFCSPNNPTGAVATREQLAALVARVTEQKCVLVFDAAYSEYIRDATLPKSIYDIDGAAACAIEVQSFSKSAGFTGVRLGWSVVPKTLRYAEGGSIHADWSRVCATIYNGASNIAQKGGLAALSPEGLREMRRLTDYYLENARLIRGTLEKRGISCAGGVGYPCSPNSPYIWAQFPGRKSWDVFAEILETCHIVTTPGSGFGPSGESFIRFSAFGHRKTVEEACARLANAVRLGQR